MPQSTNAGEDDKKARRLGLRMIIIAFLAQNCMSGFTIGSFGTLVTTFEQKFHVSREISTLGLPLVLLAIGALSPVLGSLVRRISLRALMIAGAVLGLAGYLLLSVASSMAMVLLAYGLFLGPAYALLGAMTPSALVANWFAAGRGRAIGIVNMTLFIGLVPILSSWLLTTYGITTVFLTLAIALFCLFPLLFLIVDKPSQIGLSPIGATEAEESAPARQKMTYALLCRKPLYWAVTGSGCIMSGGAMMMVTHLVPLALGWGIDPGHAALLITAIGASGIVGAPLWGWLADRLGGTTALGLNAGIQALLLFAILGHPPFILLFLIAAGLGLTTGGLTAIIGTALSELFGPENFGIAYGLYVFANLPFIVGMAPLAARLFVKTGSYTVPLLGQAVALLMVAGLGALMYKGEVRRRTSVSALDPI